MQSCWFGKHWGAPICDELPQAPVPVGKSCLHCEEPIGPEDDGFLRPYMTAEHELKQVATHYECDMRLVTGSVAHQLKQCSCYIEGADETDPPELTKRQAARLAVELWLKNLQQE